MFMKFFIHIVFLDAEQLLAPDNRFKCVLVDIGYLGLGLFGFLGFAIRWIIICFLP